MLEDGFYHADPHPGNLLKMKDGRLAYLDFGMCGSLDKKVECFVCYLHCVRVCALACVACLIDE